MEPLDETRVPVVVATGQSIDRDSSVSALDLAQQAADIALDAAGGLRRSVQLVSMVNVLGGEGPAPGAELAARTGLSPARTEVGTIGGNSPQWLLTRAASAIAEGRVDTVLVVGGEAQHSARARALGAPPSAPPSVGADPDQQAGGVPDAVVGDDRVGVGPAELNAGLLAPVHVYALFDSVHAARAGRTPEEHRRALGALMAPFTTVAAGNPYAWFPESRTARELVDIGPDNRLVAEPYPKRLCAVMHVNQGAAVVVTSLAAARAAGLADAAVFCWSGADATDVWFPTARPDPGASPGLRAAAGAALDAAGLGVDDVGAFDVYSCFPSVVTMAVEALGISGRDGRGLTVTGGLPYFGGPGNDYSLHAVASMVEHLRGAGGTGLVSALGWYATKHAVGVYGATPPPGGWRRADTTAAQRAIDASARPVAEGIDAADGAAPAVVVASTVAYARDGSVSAAPVIARLRDGRHIAAAAVAGELPALAGRFLVGEDVTVTGTPPHYTLGA
ncbi:MAG: acetyl-CoA acetyltransferase [Acidimicrobiales bacterium]|jgi:acetyl-CoA C-acetyltransferase